MPLTHNELTQIVARASTLAERLSAEVEPTGEVGSLAKRRLARWKHLCGGDGPEGFALALRSAGAENLSEEDLLSRLGPVRRKADAPWPSWSLLLNDLATSIAEAFAENGSGKFLSPVLPTRRALPFEHLYRHIATFAGERIQPQLIRLAPAAVKGLNEFLLDRLSSVASLPLHSLFLAQKALGLSESDLPQPESVVAGAIAESNPHYQAFILRMGESGMRDFMMLYPVAARMVAEVVLLWIEYVSELLGRVELDEVELSQHFNEGKPLAKLTAVRAGLSDPHHRGRTVAILDFEGGLRIVYKPRALGIDGLFFELVRHLNASGLKPNLRPLKVLNRGEYGWMEFVCHTACKNRRAARHFYRRAGSLACLVNWLQGVDFHRENIVAVADQPILVDLEALAHPPLPALAANDEPTKASLSTSILRSGLLPYWQVRPRGASLYDNSALGAPVYQRSLISSVRWLNVSTDRMQWVMGDRVHRRSAHRPRINGKVLYAQNYAADILRGYGTMAALLEGTQKSTFVQLHTQIYGSIRRRIKRPTVVYAVLLRRSLRLENLGEGIERSLAIQSLPPSVTNAWERAQEIMNLERLDVPYFGVGATRFGSGPGLPLDEIENCRQQKQMINAAVNRRLIVRDGLIEAIPE